MKQQLKLAAAAAAAAALVVLAACGGKPPQQQQAAEPPDTRDYARIDEQRLLAAADNPGQWMSHGRDYSEQRFSPLQQIDAGNVGQLGLAWFGDFDTRRGQESTPIVVDGVLYVTTAWSKVYAYDAKSGKELWKFDPQVPGQWAVNACCDVVNRGVAAWNGKVYLAAVDGRLFALDGKSGKTVWEVRAFDADKPYASTGAPRIAKGKILIGQGGSEFEQRGYISAFDAETGKLDWRWYIVPGNPHDGFENKQMEMAAKTWGGEWWKTGGGGAPWDGITYDPQTNLVFVGTGNGAPWPAEIRSPGGGDHLFLSSIVALNLDTGEYAWHFQMTPNESWDYDNTQQIVVADLDIAGTKRHVVMQASKNGFFYVLDAASGKLVSAKNFVPVNWTKGLDKNGRPVKNPEANYSKTNKGYIVLPSFAGGHSWQPMSFSPDTGLVYIPAVNFSYPFVATREDDNPMGQKLSISFAKSAEMLKDPKANNVNEGALIAWDPVKQQEVWRVNHGPLGRGGGTLATAGNLVFQGNTRAGEFAAYRADTGERLWGMAAHTGVMAGPVSYEVDGEQYVAVVAGFKSTGNYYAPNYSRVMAFRLGATGALPAPIVMPPQVLNPPPDFGTEEMRKHGETTYYRFCSTCHGTDGQSRGMFPDLRYSAALNSAQSFKAIVIDGALTQNGMVSFAKAITPEDAEAVRAFMTARSNEAKRNPPPPAPTAAPAPAPAPHQ